jgi:hypothetical protein
MHDAMVLPVCVLDKLLANVHFIQYSRMPTLHEVENITVDAPYGSFPHAMQALHGLATRYVFFEDQFATQRTRATRLNAQKPFCGRIHCLALPPQLTFWLARVDHPICCRSINTPWNSFRLRISQPSPTRRLQHPPRTTDNTAQDTTRSIMYPCYGDYWLVGITSQEYDYEDTEYDVYLFWPSSSPQVLVPSSASYLEEVGCLWRTAFSSKPNLHTQLPPLPSLDFQPETNNELDALDFGSSQLLVRSSIQSLRRNLS